MFPQIVSTAPDRFLNLKEAKDFVEKDLIRECAEANEDLLFHDFDLKSRVPLLCADPGCGTSFVTAELYHLHVATSERHKGGPNFDELHVMLLVGCQLPIPSHLR